MATTLEVHHSSLRPHICLSPLLGVTETVIPCNSNNCLDLIGVASILVSLSFHALHKHSMHVCRIIPIPGWLPMDDHHCLTVYQREWVSASINKLSGSTLSIYRTTMQDRPIGKGRAINLPHSIDDGLLQNTQTQSWTLPEGDTRNWGYVWNSMFHTGLTMDSHRSWNKTLPQVRAGKE